MNDPDTKQMQQDIRDIQRMLSRLPLRQAIGGGGGAAGGGFAIIYTPTEATLRALPDPTSEFAIAYTTTEHQLWCWMTDDWFCISHMKAVVA